MKLKYLFSFSILSILFFNVIVFSTNTYAVSGTCYFSGGDCSAPGLGDFGTNDVLSGRSTDGSGIAIDSSVNSPSALISFLEGRLSGSAQDQTGAAFIISQLTGNNSRTPNLADFEARLNQTGVTVNQVTAQPTYTSWYDTANNDDFYDWHEPVWRTVVEVRFNDGTGDKVYAQIETLCGNLVAGAIPIPPPPLPPVPPAPSVCRPWVLAIDVPTDVHSGELVPVHVTGTDVTDPSVAKKHWTTTKSSLDVTTDCTNGDVWNFHFVTDSYVYDHYDSCDGGDYCHWVHHDLYTTNRWDLNAQGPCFDYILTAGISPLGNYQVEVNSEINNITPTLKNDSWTKYNKVLPGFATVGSFYNKYKTVTKSKATEWQISQLTIAPNVPVPSLKNTSPGTPGSDNPSLVNAQTYFAAAGWKSIKTGTAVFNKNGTFKSGTNPLVPFSVSVDDLLSGTKVCFAFSVKSASSDPSNHSFTLDNTWNHSALNSNGYSINTTTAIQPCIIIVKKPKVQVWGGDLSVGKTYNSSAGTDAGISTTTSIKTFGTFGSWVEYGIFATKAISGIASGSAFNGGLGITDVTAQVCDFSKLTFTNAGTVTCSSSTAKGNYNPNRAIPAVLASFAGGSTNNVSGTIAPKNLDSGIYTSGGNITLSQSELPPGKSIILKVSGTVTIAGDQTYNSNNNGAKYTGISQLPQLVIIAGNINISRDVTRVDAWLIANAKINTCIEGGETTQLTANMCRDPLTVNGPVMAQRLFLRRTAGSNKGVDHSGDPAEIFNLRSDTYLWAYSRATSSGRVQTVYTTELPPRL